MLINEIMVTVLLVLHVVGFYLALFAPQVVFTQVPQYAFPRTFLHLERDCLYIGILMRQHFFFIIK